MRESKGKRMGLHLFPLLAMKGKLSFQVFKDSFLLCSTQRPDKLTVIYKNSCFLKKKKKVFPTVLMSWCLPSTLSYGVCWPV